MKILVTGAAGFIGFHLLKNLLNSSHLVTCIDNLNNYYDINLKKERLNQLGFQLDTKQTTSISKLNPNFSFHKIDINDFKKIVDLFQQNQFDIVIHLAAQAGVRYSLKNPKSYIKTNIEGFFNIIEQSKNYSIKTFIYASSSSVYGLNSELPYDENMKVDKPVSLYAATKKSNELIAYSYSHLYGLKTIGLRFFTVYGPWGRPDMAYYKFSDHIYRGKPIDVYNKGLNKRDFTFIDDVIDCFLKIIKNNTLDKKYNIFNIGNNKSVSVNKFISILEKNLNKKALKNYVDFQMGDVIQTLSDTSLVEKNYGFKANTDLEVGLKHFCEWYLKYLKKTNS